MDESAAPAEAASPPPANTGPRFPWLAALLCAASLGVAAWTWMRYSYAWEVALTDIHNLAGNLYPDTFDTSDSQQRGGPYVRLRGVKVGTIVVEERTYFAHVTTPQEPGVEVMVRVRAATNMGDGPVKASGRVMKLPGYEWWEGWPPVVDTTASRLHPASIGGLVVGAMGVFVFAVYLRTWVKGRRAS